MHYVGQSPELSMVNETINLSIEIGKLLASIATPIVLAAFGLLLLRRIESVKAIVAKQSGFETKWAELFFECCQEFMKALERDLSLWKCLSGLEKPNDEFGSDLQRQISQLNVAIPELELRIRRCIVFAPSTGAEVAATVDECMRLLKELTVQRKGNLDEIILKMNEFNNASRTAHAEMLGLNIVQPATQPGLAR
jgi:hypothetical protein